MPVSAEEKGREQRQGGGEKGGKRGRKDGKREKSKVTEYKICTQTFTVLSDYSVEE